MKTYRVGEKSWYIVDDKDKHDPIEINYRYEDLAFYAWGYLTLNGVSIKLVGSK